MAVPKIVSPRGMLLLAMGVAISAGFASSQPNSVSIVPHDGPAAAANPFTVTKPEECVLIFDHNVPGIFVHNGQTFNDKPVYRKVRGDGGWAGRYVYYDKAGKWNYYVRLHTNPKIRFGYAISDNPVCPDDGADFHYQFWNPRRFVKTGKVHRATPPTYGLCKPYKGTPAADSVSSTKVVAAPAASLTECARYVMRLHPDAAGSQWEKDKCLALFGTDVKINPDKTKGVPTKFTCVFQCNLMPGAMKHYIPSRKLDPADNVQQCIAHIKESVPAANALTYRGSDKTCSAEFDGRYPDVNVTGSRTCWSQPRWSGSPQSLALAVPEALAVPKGLAVPKAPAEVPKAPAEVPKAPAEVPKAPAEVPKAPAVSKAPAVPSTVTKPEQCVLIFDNNVQGIFVHNGETFNGKPVYKKIKDDGGWSDRYIYYAREGEWNYSPHKKTDPNWRFGYAESNNTLCPDDGSVFRYLLWKPNKHFGVTGKVYRAMPPTWAKCNPVSGNPQGVTASQTLNSFSSLTECARNVAGLHPDAVGAHWEKDNEKCMALWGNDAKIVHEVPVGAPKASGCIFKCGKLPANSALPDNC